MVGGLAGGFLWARLTDRVPLPEWLLMLTSPIGTSVLFVPLTGAIFTWQMMRLPGHFDVDSVGAVVVLVFKSGLLGGIVAGGLPAILGWVIGHRRMGR